MGSLKALVEKSSFDKSWRHSLCATGRSAELIRGFPWELTPLGDLDQWDSQFVSNLNLMLEAHFPMFLTWGSDNHLFYNDAFETALVGKGDCIGRPLQAVFPESWPQIRRFLMAALNGRPSYHEDLPVALVRNFTLTSTWWTVSYSPARTQDGSIGGVLGVLHETTRRIAAEQSLRSSEAALLAVTDMTPSLIWRSDRHGRIVWANQGLHAYFGLKTLDDVRWEDKVHPDEVETARQIGRENLLAGRPFACQQRLRGADGEFRWFIIRAQQIRDGEQFLGWCGSALDIDDWRLAADDMQDRDRILRRFYESENTLMWVGVVGTREIEPLNPDLRPAWGMSADGRPVVWERWLTFAHPDDRPQLSGLFDRAAAGEVAQARFRSVSASGAVRRFHATGFALPDGDDGARRVGGLFVEVASNDDPRIYLIDSNPAAQNAMSHGLTRKGFRVRTFDDAAEFQKICGDLAPGCAILSISGDIDAVLKTAAILKANRRLPWIAIGNLHDRLQDVVQLMKLGAADILSSPTPDDVAAAGRAALAVAFGKVLERRGPGDALQKIAQLSQRERQVFDGLVAGGTNKTIAKALNLSPRTIETHRSHLMNRLDVSTLAELVQLAAEGRSNPRG